ncbi:MAG: helix-turn-helix domain-containing protein [Candidatus Methanogranum gryphiswaldense]|nr:MAG: helix-turn-helix domain-containing protein [Candidatus Methanogranum sp. U3.2.1]
MDSKILENLIDPVRGKILLEIRYAEKISVKGLCTRCQDIPRSTMYRHLAKLEKAGLVTVVDTTRKRGTVEKTYSLAEEAFMPSEDQVDPSPEFLLALFTQYCMAFIQEFQNGLRREGFDLKKDIMGFTTAPIYATEYELDNAVQIIGRTISRLAENPATPERKMHSIGLIITPPKVTK